MKKVLVVVDMQKDFIDGALGSPQAQAIVPNVVEKIRLYQDEGNDIVFTQDTHFENYLETQEGKYLPVIHCVEGTEGWEIPAELINEVNGFNGHNKNTFGSLALADVISEMKDIEEVELCGLCTDICVVSNALILKAKLPELKVTVDGKCCAGVSEESHKAALLTMKMCQVNIINE